MLSIRYIVASCHVICLVSCVSPVGTAPPKKDVAYVVETEVIAPVEKFSIERRYIGTIRSEKFSILSPRVAGTIATIDVKPGEHVKKGQLLASLKSSGEQRGIELAEESVRSFEIERNRTRTLFKTRDVTKSQVEKSERDVLVAQSKLEEQRNLIEIRSPFDGVVGVPRVVLGEMVTPSSSIITVMDGPFSVVVNIPGSRLSEVNAGQKVTLKNSVTTVAAVERSIDPTTRTGFAKAIFGACETCIVGDSVYVHITVREKSNAILIPRNAIYYKNGKPFVVVASKTESKLQAIIREIVIGDEHEGRTEVISGLSAGDQIVVSNPKRIPADAQLTVAQ